MENKESFHARIKPFFSHSEEQKVKLAYYLAKYGHRAQFRKELLNGEPMRYFEHVRRVAIVLMDEARCMHSEMIVSALLHDALEDTEDLTPELLEFSFGPDVVSIVKRLSKVPKEGYVERLMVSTDWRVLMIKACDRLDNLRSLMVPGTSVAFQKRQLAETQEKYFPVFKRLLKLVPDDHHDGAMKIRDEILKTVERHKAVIEMKESEVKSVVEVL